MKVVQTCEIFSIFLLCIQNFRHEVAEVAGLASFSFGQEEIDRCVIVWKKVCPVPVFCFTYFSIIHLCSVMMKFIYLFGVLFLL